MCSEWRPARFPDNGSWRPRHIRHTHARAHTHIQSNHLGFCLRDREPMPAVSSKPFLLQLSFLLLLCSMAAEKVDLRSSFLVHRGRPRGSLRKTGAFAAKIGTIISVKPETVSLLFLQFLGSARTGIIELASPPSERLSVADTSVPRLFYSGLSAPRSNRSDFLPNRDSPPSAHIARTQAHFF